MNTMGDEKALMVRKILNLPKDRNGFHIYKDVRIALYLDKSGFVIYNPYKNKKRCIRYRQICCVRFDKTPKDSPAWWLVAKLFNMKTMKFKKKPEEMTNSELQTEYQIMINSDKRFWVTTGAQRANELSEEIRRREKQK